MIVSQNPPGGHDEAASAKAQDPHYRHFRTDHLVGNLKSRAISGGVFTVSAQIAKFALYMASIAALARLLTPEDFGLVTMVGALISFLRLFREAGLFTVTVQRQEITHAQVSNLFWINIALGMSACLLGVVLSPLVAWFYRDPRLVKVMIALSTTFLFSGAAVQHLALLNRQMRFKAVALIDVSASVAGLGVGVVLALSKCGYWALVFQQLASAWVELALAWTASKWRPQWPKRKADTLSMVTFGASITINRTLRRMANSMDTLLIGRYYDAVAVGLYSRGMALLLRPLDQFLAPFDMVAVPVLSRLQDQVARYRATFLEVYHALSLLGFPAAGVLLALSKPIVLVMLGPQWGGTIPIFGVLVLAALAHPFAFSTMWLLETQGRNKDVVWSGVLFSSIRILSFLAGLRWGPVGVAIGFSTGEVLVRLPLQFYITGRSGPVTIMDLWMGFLAHLPCCLAAAAASYFVMRGLSHFSPLIQLLAACPAGLAAAVIVIIAVKPQRETAVRAFTALYTHFRARRGPQPQAA